MSISRHMGVDYGLNAGPDLDSAGHWSAEEVTEMLGQ